MDIMIGNSIKAYSTSELIEELKHRVHKYNCC